MVSATAAEVTDPQMTQMEQMVPIVWRIRQVLPRYIPKSLLPTQKICIGTQKI
jgi:hypothetical protein